MIHILALEADHWQGVRAIFLEGIAGGHATFETEAPGWQVWNKGHLPEPRLVAVDGERVVGWGALSPVSERCIYGGVAEVSVYVARSSRRLGIGKSLLIKLIQRSEQRGIWTLQAGIFPENVASVRLFRSCGFRIVGTRVRLGELQGIWRDVLLLERRSDIAGR